MLHLLGPTAKLSNKSKKNINLACWTCYFLWLSLGCSTRCFRYFLSHIMTYYTYFTQIIFIVLSQAPVLNLSTPVSDMAFQCFSAAYFAILVRDMLIDQLFSTQIFFSANVPNYLYRCGLLAEFDYGRHPQHSRRCFCPETSLPKYYTSKSVCAWFTIVARW